MIILETIKVYSDYTHKEELLVNKAFRADTLEVVILPCDHPKNLGGYYSSVYNCWVIDE